MNQILFNAPTFAGSITSRDIPQNVTDLQDWVFDARHIKEGKFPQWQFCDWGGRYGAWAMDYVVDLIGVGENNIAFARLPNGRIDEFGLYSLFPITM